MSDPLYSAFLKDRIWHFVSYQEFSQTFQTISDYEQSKIDYALK